MSRGTGIIASGTPRGRIIEGIITDTSKPGMVVEIVPATAMKSGKHSWRASSTTTGAQRMIAVLMPDFINGKLATDAYAASTLCQIYFPVMGDELNMLVTDIAGTGDTIAIADKYGVASTGKLHADSSYTIVPFLAMEASVALTADTLIWMIYAAFGAG